MLRPLPACPVSTSQTATQSAYFIARGPSSPSQRLPVPMQPNTWRLLGPSKALAGSWAVENQKGAVAAAAAAEVCRNSRRVAGLGEELASEEGLRVLTGAGS